MAKRKDTHNSYLWAKICVGMIGVIMSIVLHELFHILVHWGDIERYGLFSRHGAVVELLVWAPQGYDLEGEEMFAYAITLITLLFTVMLIFRIQDATDDRTAAQILFPNNKEMQKIPPPELLSMAELSAHDILPSQPPATEHTTPTRAIKPVTKPQKKKSKQKKSKKYQKRRHDKPHD